MISWRYHLVSIVAVFLALGLGVLAGTTVLDEGLVNRLEGQADRLQQDLEDYRAEVGELRGEADTMGSFAEQALPYLVESRLPGWRVVVVTQDSVDGSALDSVRGALDLAGAQVQTTLTIQPDLAAEESSVRNDLAEIVGFPSATPPAELTALAASSLARRLATAPVISDAGEASDDDLLGNLLSAGFLTAGQPAISDVTLGEIGGPDQVVVVVGGASAASAPSSDTFLLPFVQALVSHGITTAASESQSSEDGFVSAIRDALDADAITLVTVDNAEGPLGSAALVLGLEQVGETGTGGDYGIDDGASRVLPAPS
jgi:hypothetical protein